MCSEKKKRSAGCKRYKKRKNSSPCIIIRKRGRKGQKRVAYIAHTPGRRQLARAQHRATLLLLLFLSFVFVASFLHMCACVCEKCASKRKDVSFVYFWANFFRTIFIMREEKRTKFSSSSESSSQKQKAKRCLSSLLTPITKTACALDKAFAATIEGSSRESHHTRIHHVHHSHRRENSNFGTMFFPESPVPIMNLANDFGDDFAEMRGTKRSWEEEDLHTPAPRQTIQTTTTNNATTSSCFFPPPHSTSGDTKERIKNFRNDDDIDDFDDCFSIGVRMQRMEQENASGRTTQSVTSIPSEIDASQGGIPMIDSNAVKKLLLEDENGVVLIDCRYFYEYRNGRISSSHNVVFPDDCQRGFIIARDKLLNCANHRNSEKRDLVYVFYDDGEANAMAMHHRATQLFRHIRNLDRLDNMHTYPNLCFPNMFVLKGGFKAFIESSRDREWEDDHRIFYEGSFVSMDDWRFSNETKELHNQVVKRWILAAAAQSLNDFPTRV